MFHVEQFPAPTDHRQMTGVAGSTNSWNLARFAHASRESHASNRECICRSRTCQRRRGYARQPMTPTTTRVRLVAAVRETLKVLFRRKSCLI